MGHSEDNDLRQQLLVHNAEWKLTKSVLAELIEIGWPAFRCESDVLYSTCDRPLKINRGGEATFSIPLK